MTTAPVLHSSGSIMPKLLGEAQYTLWLEHVSASARLIRRLLEEAE